MIEIKGASELITHIGRPIGAIVHPAKVPAKGCPTELDWNNWTAITLVVDKISCVATQDGIVWEVSGIGDNPPRYISDLPLDQCYPSEREALIALTD